MNFFQDRFNRYEGLDQAGQPPPDPCSENTAPGTLPAHVSGGPTDAHEGHPEELVLALGDFLHRIPAHLLKPGHHDVGQEIRFSLTDIANWIAQRITTIPIRLIHQQAPAIFDDAVRDVEGLEIRFPWQKVLHLINETASAAPADSLAVKLKTRCTIENVPGARTNMPPPGASPTHSSSAGGPGRPGETWLSRARQNARQPAPGSTAAGPGAMGRSPKEYERTITELNRRIIALESTQKERAQELAKEREHRLKLERQLSSTERALQESATFAENTRAEARRDLEVELRRRDAEAARVSKDHQKQIEMVKEELARVREERDELREKVKGSGDSGLPNDGWESPAVIRLNAEISECRERIQGLMDEREELMLENEELLRRIEAAHQGQA